MGMYLHYGTYLHYGKAVTVSLFVVIARVLGFNYNIAIANFFCVQYIVSEDLRLSGLGSIGDDV